MAEKTLLKAFSEALVNVENPKLDSTAKVKTKQGYEYTYDYASLKECMRTVKEACKPLGLAIYFSVEYLVTAGCWIVSTIVTDGKEEMQLSTVPVKVDGLPQSNGSEITYAKRYSLSAAFGLVSEEDDDAQMAQNQQKNKNAVNTQKDIQDARKEAQNRLKRALVEYCGGDADTAKQIYDSYWKQEGFSDTPEWFNNKANEVLTELRGA